MASNELSISLGSAPPGPSGVHAETLKSAKPKELEDGSLSGLKITVSGSDNLGVVLNPMDLSAFAPGLQPDATVSIYVLGSTSSDLQVIHTSFLLAGLKGVSEAKAADGSRIFRATKPAAISTTAVKLNDRMLIDDDDDDDDGLIDEDALLSDTSNLLAPPPAMTDRTKQDDCSGRAPCENCTCGRADTQNGGGPTTTTTTNTAPKTSSCGKCGLGDAFRCASCPYLGKPAFKPGEEHLVLDLQDDL